MLALQTCAAVQLRRAVAVHIHQLCHRETGQQSLEAIVRAGGSLAVLVLQGGDLIQIRLCTLRCKCAEVSRACGADCHCAGQYGAQHCLSKFVHRDSPSFYQACAFSSLYGSGLSASTVSRAEFFSVSKIFYNLERIYRRNFDDKISGK